MKSKASQFTTIGKGHGAPCLPADKDAWIKARTTKSLADICRRIETSTDESEQKHLKEQLPVWTPRCAEFRNNHRAEADAMKPLGRLMFDIDQKGRTDEIMVCMTDTADGEREIGGFRVLMVEESVRRGTHVLVDLPLGMTADEAQRRFSKAIGIEVDPAVKNVAGCIYMVSEDHVRYQSPRFFEYDATPLHSTDSTPDEPQSAAGQTIATETEAKTYPTDYDGIPYDVLVDAMSEQLGGIPTHGSRNNFIFSMACHLRYVCNSDPEWIAQVLPTYGEDPERVRSTIRSACARAQSSKMPQFVTRSISMARSRISIRNGNYTNPVSSPLPPPLPEKLPRLIQLLTSKVPDMYKPAVAQGVFAPLGAHLSGVTVRYINNEVVDLGGFMVVCMARQSIGKGAINMPIQMIMADILEADALGRSKENEWKKANKQAKANEKKPARPEDICVQFLMNDMTHAALVMRLNDANNNGGKFLYCALDEIEMLDQIRSSGGSSASEVIRLAFTQSPYGQERASADSISGRPPLRFSFNASTTIPGGKQYFRNSLTNGTVTRLSFSTIIKPMGMRGVPQYGDYDEKFANALRPYLERLKEAKGLIRCRQAERMSLQMAEENEELAEMSGDDAFEILSYRANRIVYDRAMLLYIAQGCRWTKDIEEFCRWSEQYDLWCKVHFFGERLNELTAESEVTKTYGPKNLLDMMSNRFGRYDLQYIHRSEGCTGDYMQLIYTWMHRGYIELDATTGEYVKTEKYLERHKRT